MLRDISELAEIEERLWHGLMRRIVDSGEMTAGLAPYLQLLSLQNLKLAYGSGTCTWPGGSNGSSATNVVTGLSTIASPGLIGTGNQTLGAGINPYLEVLSIAGGTVSVAMINPLSQPAATTSAAFGWIAFGT